MGNRLSKIYTRTGDDGSTGLAGGRRVAKHDLRIACCGDVDELNSVIGLVLAENNLDTAWRNALTEIQHDLFELGAELSMPEYQIIDEPKITQLEVVLDSINATLPPLKEFVLPGGNRAAATCHLARAVCRRAERTLWALAEHEVLRRTLPGYLNRLSDLLFVMARACARADGGSETLWSRLRN
jgi:cob(I)alamin adenosyltransferase